MVFSESAQIRQRWTSFLLVLAFALFGRSASGSGGMEHGGRREVLGHSKAQLIVSQVVEVKPTARKSHQPLTPLIVAQGGFTLMASPGPCVDRLAAAEEGTKERVAWGVGRGRAPPATGSSRA